MAIAVLPHISISPAPPEEPLKEPHSPFSWVVSPVDDEDNFRPRLLTPPPSGPVRRTLSPLSPSDSPNVGKGLERERFDALLKASRERNSAVGAKKTPDLRKEIALKAHKNKQVERRALFLSKVLAPPSPTATTLPKTPPDSPAIFHYSLPSPGLVSPLALFESLQDGSPTIEACTPWVEQVDFRAPKTSHSTSDIYRGLTPIKSSGLPSLDEISARMTRTPSNIGATRLPEFLTSVRQSNARPSRLPAAVGRLQLPARAQKPRPENLNFLPPKTPSSPNLQVTTLVVPRSSTLSPTELSEANVLALDCREQRAQDMFSALRRRVIGVSDHGLNGRDEIFDRRIRRRSAPADLGPLKARTGFEHPVLAMPGGF